jgi:hypothetical protein
MEAGGNIGRILLPRPSPASQAAQWRACMLAGARHTGNPMTGRAQILFGCAPARRRVAPSTEYCILHGNRCRRHIIRISAGFAGMVLLQFA